MGDKLVEIISREDQGTIFMLCLTIGLAFVATIYFLCRWNNKRTLKQLEVAKQAETKTVMKKDRLKQTFSRFSQVDEELTMTQIDDDDLELLQSCQTNPISSTSGERSTPLSYNMAAANPDHAGVDAKTKSSGKPYLETDI